jgi:hypothetical protein
LTQALIRSNTSISAISISPSRNQRTSSGVWATREVSATLGKLVEKLDSICAIPGALMSSVMPRRSSPVRSL